MNNKNIFADNLKKYMELNGKSRREICEALGFSYYTFSDWVNGKKYPRMDKVEMLANYFGIKKSDLIEKKATPEGTKNSNTIADITDRMFKDSDFMEVVQFLHELNQDEIDRAKKLLQLFFKEGFNEDK